MRLFSSVPLLFATFASASSVYQSSSACFGPTYQVKKAFGEAGLVPPTVPAVGSKTYLSVQYNDSQKAELGNFFNQSDVAAAPAVYFAADPRKLYTLIMVDPDVPPEYGPQIRHWVVSDLKPSCTQSTVLNGTTQSAYKGPMPIGDHPFHRYALYLFVQPTSASFPPPDTNITNFVIQDYIAKVGLEGPISGNFFKVEDNGQNE